MADYKSGEKREPKPSSEVGLKELAEEHVGAAIKRLGALVGHEDARVAFEASQLIIQLARPHSPGVLLGAAAPLAGSRIAPLAGGMVPRGGMLGGMPGGLPWGGGGLPWGGGGLPWGGAGRPWGGSWPWEEVGYWWDGWRAG